jgi:SAM-dependent methyltransferase
MRHVNYPRWAAYVAGLFSLADGRVRTVLDAACGTGNMMLELAGAGFEVSGFDASVSMVQQARHKFEARRVLFPDDQARKNGSQLPMLWCADMQRLAAHKLYDATLCLYDSMNYCPTLEAISGVLRSGSGIVRQGGLLIFDVCTRHNCVTHFSNFHERDAMGPLSFTRWSHYQPHQRTQVNEFLIVDERDKSRFREVHRQKIYPVAEVKRLCDSPEWHLLGCYDGFSRQTGDENSDRVHFVLRRR